MKTKALILGLFFTFILLGTLCAEDVMFNFQGRVKVQGTLFTGTGNFKFAIVNNAGNITLWSNDGTSVGGGEPTASIPIGVTDGIFNVMVGDPDAGMTPINRTIFNHPEKIKLRIWFSNGTLGFQQLLPDHHLTNIELLGMTTGTDDFTIYVNGTTGNDNNNGLSPSKAKKTIQAAVYVLPERLHCNVTIDIADGIYRERVNIYGITMNPEKILTLQGDESWAGTGDPAVRITGNDDDTSDKYVRSFAVYARNCSNIRLKGIMFDGGSVAGLSVNDGTYTIFNCKAKDNGSTGMSVSQNCTASFYDCIAEYNSYGFYISTNSYANFFRCKSLNNTEYGVTLNTMATGSFRESGDFSNNGGAGIAALHNCKLFFADGYSGTINNNGNYPIRIRFDSYCEDHTKNTFSGNSPSNTVYTDNGGDTYT